MRGEPDDAPEGPAILLVNPWITDLAAYDLWARPLGLLYLAAVLRDHGYRVCLVDCLHGRGRAERAAGQRTGDGRGKLNKKPFPKPAPYARIPRRYGRYGISETDFRDSLTKGPDPAVILVTSGMTYWYPGVVYTIGLLRNRYPEVPIVLGGIYATLCTEHARRRSGADRVLPGPGESRALAAVDEICGRSSRRRPFDRLEEIPFPAFDLYDRADAACLLTSRGCPLRCTYCAAHLLAPDFRQRPVEHVLAELEWLRRGLRIRHVAFYDDALLVTADEHIKPILECVIERDLDLRFHTPNGLHARLLDLQTAELMFRSGFQTVRLSLETAEESLQRRIGPKATADDLARALDHLALAGFRREEIGVYLLAGLPGQRIEDIIESIDFVFSLGATVKLALYSPIPSTSEWSRAVREGPAGMENEPLWHNNTAYSLASPALKDGGLERIKEHVRYRNRSLAH